MSDPFVLDLVEAVDDRVLTSRFHALLNSLHGARPDDGGLPEVRRALLRTQSAVVASADGDHAIEQGVLALVLDDLVRRLGEDDGRGPSLYPLNEAN